MFPFFGQVNPIYYILFFIRVRVQDQKKLQQEQSVGVG